MIMAVSRGAGNHRADAASACWIGYKDTKTVMSLSLDNGSRRQPTCSRIDTNPTVRPKMVPLTAQHTQWPEI